MSADMAVEGVVRATYPSNMFEVEIEIGASTRSVLARRMGRLYRERILVGDRVRVELSPFDTSRGCIVRRLDPPGSI